jgi:hypothetical protein
MANMNASEHANMKNMNMGKSNKKANANKNP